MKTTKKKEWNKGKKEESTENKQIRKDGQRNNQHRLAKQETPLVAHVATSAQNV